jgi:hypothetical protein
MGVALIAWGQFFDPHGNRVTVRAPTTDAGAPWLFDVLARNARKLRKAGFSQLPPTSATVRVRPDLAGWQTGSAAHLQVTDAHGQAIPDHRCGAPATVLHGRATIIGECAASLAGERPPDHGSHSNST